MVNLQSLSAVNTAITSDNGSDTRALTLRSTDQDTEHVTRSHTLTRDDVQLTRY